MKRVNKLINQELDRHTIPDFFEVGDEFDCWIYSIHLDNTDILNFQLKYTRKILPMKVKAVVSSDNVKYFCYGKNGKLLKKYYPHTSSYKYPLNVFLNEEECILHYEKTLEDVVNNIDEHIKSSENLKTELIKFILDKRNQD